MFKEVLAIGGKPGLFKLVSYAKNYVIVESLIDGKRQPAYQSEKISLLRDIVMFGNVGEKKLSQLFKATFELESGAKVDIDTKNSNALQDFFAMIMLIDITEMNISIDQLRENLKKNVKGMDIHVMHEDIFNTMHKI